MTGKIRQIYLNGRYAYLLPPKIATAAYLILCSYLLFLIQFVYLSCLQNSQNFILKNLLRPSKIIRVYSSDLPGQALTLLPENNTSSDPLSKASPLIKPINLGDRFNYSYEETFSNKKIEKLSVAPPLKALTQFDNGPEKFTNRMLPPEPQQSKEDFFHSLILRTSHRHALDPALIKAIILAESGFNPKAISKKGAKGLMQLMPGTAKALGVEDVFDPAQNIEGGVRYFKKLLHIFNGDIKLALAAYNAGMGKVIIYKGVPPFKVTKYYIKKVIKYRESYRKQMIAGLVSFQGSDVMKD